MLLVGPYPPDPRAGGVGSYMAALGDALGRCGHEVHVLSLAESQEPSDSCEGRVHVHRRRLPPLPTRGGLGRVPWTVGRLRDTTCAYLEAKRLHVAFDVAETSSWGGSQLLLALRRQVPVVTSLVTTLGVVRRELGIRPGRDGRIGDFLEWLAIRFSALAIADSDLHATHLARIGYRVPEERLVTSWLPVKPRGAARDTSADPPTVLQVGRLERRKRPDLLVEALARLGDHGIRIRGVFVGQENERIGGLPYSEWLRGLAEGRNVDIEVHGYLPPDQLEVQLQRAMLVCMPSDYESFGLSAAEAMAAGKPIIITEHTGLAEVVRGTAADFVVPVGDADQLAQTIVRLWRDADLRRRAGSAGQQLVAERLAPHVIASARTGLYERIVRGRRD